MYVRVSALGHPSGYLVDGFVVGISLGRQSSGILSKETGGGYKTYGVVRVYVACNGVLYVRVFF